MVLDWLGGSKTASLEDLLARKKYHKVIEILRGQFQEGRRDPRLRMQLADVLVLAGKGREAVPILVGLADEFAREGFAAKAIAVLKKVERVEPGRGDVTRKLAALIEKQRESTGSFLVPSSRRPAALPEIGIEEIHEAPAEIALAVGSQRPEPAPEATPSLDLEDSGGMSEADFDQELHGLIEANLATPVEPVATGGGAAGQAAVSPLFSDFTQDELLAVIQGLELISFEAGDIIVTEGEAGDSLFILTTGTARVFVRGPAGRSVRIRDMSDGSFFGEISILTGKPRTATVTAATRCELLELNRDALDTITRGHPRVKEVLRRFYEERAMSAEEKRGRQQPGGGRPQAG